MLSRARSRTAAALLTAGLLLTACSGTDDPTIAAGDDTASDGVAVEDATSDDATSDEATSDDATSDDGTSDGATAGEGAVDGGSEGGSQPTAADDGTDPAADDPVVAVRTATATAPDGSTFTIDDFAGQPVLVETFATWCSTCREQLGATQQAAVEAGDDAVFLVLSVETTIDPAQLATYAQEHGFTDLRFGVLDEQGLADFTEVFGRSVLNPPSTPKFRVTPDGAVSGLTTGMESAEEILATLGAA